MYPGAERFCSTVPGGSTTVCCDWFLLQEKLQKLHVALDMKTLEDGWCVAMKTYKFAVFEILRDFLHWHILHVCRIPT